jgi:hypothetical protein
VESLSCRSRSIASPRSPLSNRAISSIEPESPSHCLPDPIGGKVSKKKRAATRAWVRRPSALGRALASACRGSRSVAWRSRSVALGPAHLAITLAAAGLDACVRLEIVGRPRDPRKRSPAPGSDRLLDPRHSLWSSALLLPVVGFSFQLCCCAQDREQVAGIDRLLSEIRRSLV